MGTDHDWEQWGVRDPYFGVLTDPKFRRAALTAEARAEFFASGDAHVRHTLESCRLHVDPAFAPTRALDFGCGVGRLVIPLSRLVAEVVGVDVSPSMLEEARHNCVAADVHNVSLITSDDGLSHLTGDFDFVHSFIVFQHVDVERGRQLFERLVALLRPGGIGVLHVTFGWTTLTDSFGQPPQPVLSEAPCKPAPAVPKTQRVKSLLNSLGLRSEEPVQALVTPHEDPAMQMNCYNLSELLFIVQRAGVQRTHTQFTNHGGALGALLYFQIPSVEPTTSLHRLEGIEQKKLPGGTALKMTNIDYKDDFVSAIAEYTTGNPQARDDRVEIELNTKLIWMRSFFEACRPHVDFEGRTFLEVGCGTGYTSIAASEIGMKPECTDFVAKACELAQWRFREHEMLATVFQSDLRESVASERLAKYGFVFCSQVLEHIPRSGQFKALRNLFGMVAPGGYLYINTENSLYPFDRHDTKLPLVRLLSKAHAEALTMALGKSLNIAEPSYGESIAIHDYPSYDEVIGAAAVMGFEVVNPFMPFGTARAMFKVLTGSDWFYESTARFFDAERFLPISVLLRRAS